MGGTLSLSASGYEIVAIALLVGVGFETGRMAVRFVFRSFSRWIT